MQSQKYGRSLAFASSNTSSLSCLLALASSNALSLPQTREPLKIKTKKYWCNYYYSSDRENWAYYKTAESHQKFKFNRVGLLAPVACCHLVRGRALARSKMPIAAIKTTLRSLISRLQWLASHPCRKELDKCARKSTLQRVHTLKLERSTWTAIIKCSDNQTKALAMRVAWSIKRYHRLAHMK